MPGERLMVHHKAAAQIHQARSIFHGAHLIFAKQILILRLAIDVQRDHIRNLQQLAEDHPAGVSARHHETPRACPAPPPDPTPATQSSRSPQSPASVPALRAIPPTTYSTPRHAPACSPQTSAASAG